MNETIIKMDMFSGSIQVGVRLWSRIQKKYRWAYLTFDTGASVTVISPEILYHLRLFDIELLFSKEIIKLKRLSSVGPRRF